MDANVLNAPTQVKASVVWINCRFRKPSTDVTVLVATAGPDCANCWLGWYDKSSNSWRSASDGWPMLDVAWWAHLPEMPKE